MQPVYRSRFINVSLQVIGQLCGSRCGAIASSQRMTCLPRLIAHLASPSPRFAIAINFAGQNQLPFRPYVYQIQKRHRKKSAGKEEEENNEDDESGTPSETNNVEEGDSRDWVAKTLQVPSARLDTLLKTALMISRNKVDDSFLEGKLRLNGVKVTKKANEAAIGDEIDLIIGPDPKNPSFLEVSRVVVDEIGTEAVKNKIPVKVKVWRSLTVDNYSGPNRYTLAA